MRDLKHAPKNKLVKSKVFHHGPGPGCLAQNGKPPER